MKTVILCGGMGTRLGEHGRNVPKALIQIGGKAVLWHLLKIYSHYGMNEFVLCLGHLGDEIKRYFALDMSGTTEIPEQITTEDDFKIIFAETGLNTNTGGRLKRAETYLSSDETFCVTYGDGLSDVNLKNLISFHKSHGKIATLTAVNPFSSFGLLKFDEAGAITEFQEKPRLNQWINGGFFVFNREIFDYLDQDCILEREPLERLAAERELMAFQHTGFWKCVDTYKDNLEFNDLWDSGSAAWKVW